MKTILALLKLQIDNKTDLLKVSSPKKMLLSILKVVLTLTIATVGVKLAFQAVFGKGVFITEGIISILLLITQAISLFFAIGNIIQTLYLSRDNQMLICLPVTPNQLFISKILLIYLREVAVNASICIPLFIALALQGSLGFVFYISLPLLILMLPILPIVLASFLSIPIMSLIQFLKKHVVLSIVSLLTVVAVCFWGYVSVIAKVAGNFDLFNDQIKIFNMINQTVASLSKHIVLYMQLAKATLSFGQWFWYPLFLVLCVALSTLTILIIRPLYFKIAMSSLENTVRSKEKKSKFKKTNPFFSLIKKEALCIFRSPTDIFEYFLFTLLMPFMVFSYDKLLSTLAVSPEGVNMISGAHVMALAILAMLSNLSSASAISRDGGNFYTSKIIPINYYAQIFAKMTFNALFTGGALLVTMVISFFSEGAVAWQIVMGTVAVMFASIGHIAWSIDMDINNPTVNLQGNEDSSITSKSTPKSMVAGLIIGFVLGMIVILMSDFKSLMLPYLIIIALSVVFAIYRVYMLILRIHLRYDKIEM